MTDSGNTGTAKTLRPEKGLLIVLSGPSGSGKGTLLAEMVKDGSCAVNVSVTTRAPREGEVDGVHYHFVTDEQFAEMRDAGRFLEYAGYVGHFYGTLLDETEALRATGRHVILEIEVQGALQVREKCPDAVLVFTLPPSEEELRRRLKKRGTETDDVIEARIARAREELPFSAQYDYIVLNDALEDAVSDFRAVVRAESIRPGRCKMEY